LRSDLGIILLEECMDLSMCQDKIDHCHVDEDGDLFCDLCSVEIDGTWEGHAHCGPHLRRRNAYLKECEVPELIAQDRMEEVEEIMTSNIDYDALFAAIKKRFPNAQFRVSCFKSIEEIETKT